MSQPTEDPVARADAIKAELFHQMTLENTPAAFQDDRFDYDDDEWMSTDNRSDALERELHDLYHSDPDAFRGSEYESWFAQPDNPDRPDETFLDDDRYLDAEGPGDPLLDNEPEESDADRAADAAYQEYLDDLDTDSSYDGRSANPDIPDLTAPEAVPDVASFDALDAWWAEADRTGDASAAHEYAQDFQDTADRAEAAEPAAADPPGDER